MLCFVFAALVVLLDQFLKQWVVLTIELRGHVAIIPGVIGLTNEGNPGAAFNILMNQRWLLVGIAIVAAILLVAILLRYNDGFWGTLGLAAVLGGTVGNLIDRLLHGYVVDMFDLYFMEFAIFNIADIFITLGGITFLIYFIITAFRPSGVRDNPALLEIGETNDDNEPPDDRFGVEDQIGLYDFEYGDDNPEQAPDADDALSDTKTIQIRYPARSAPEPGIIDSAYDDEEPLEDIMSAIEALNELESDFLETDILEDYDIDDLLREYGFEDDKD